MELMANINIAALKIPLFSIFALLAFFVKCSIEKRSSISVS